MKINKNKLMNKINYQKVTIKNKILLTEILHYNYLINIYLINMNIKKIMK